MAVSLPADPLAQKFPNVGSLVSQVLPYIYGIAGLALLLMLIWGGITLMTAAGSADKVKDGYGKITGSLVGFLIIFVSYFVFQLLETVFGINIFN
jgi:hypothetical protein